MEPYDAPTVTGISAVSAVPSLFRDHEESPPQSWHLILQRQCRQVRRTPASTKVFRVGFGCQQVLLPWGPAPAWKGSVGQRLRHDSRPRVLRLTVPGVT